MTQIYNFFFNNKLSNSAKYIYAFFFGSIFVLCFPPYSFWPLIFPSIAYLFLASYLSTSAKESFFIGWFFGLAFFTLGLYWIFNSFIIRSDFYIYLIPFCLFILSSFLGLFIALISFLNFKFKKKILTSVIYFSIFWTLSELLRSYLFTGLPWNLIGHIWINFTNILQICSILGVYGLTFLTVLFVLSVCIFFLKKKFLKKNEIIFFTSIFIFFGVVTIFGEIRLNNATINIYDSTIYRVVQPNISQKDKLNTQKIEKNFNKLVDLSFVNKMTSFNASEKLVILWPETAITNLNYLSSLPIFNKLSSKLKKGEYLISGAFKEEEKFKNTLYYNSIVVIDNNLSQEFIYDKYHLVPFGEYIPFEKIFNKFGLNIINLQKNDSPPKPIIKYKDFPTFKTLICYEIIFPKYSKNSDFLFNFTNDAWFGNTPGPYQHFVHSIFRAIEQGAQVIRIANTGISASIDPFGRIMKKIDLNVEGQFDTNLVTGNSFVNPNIPLTTLYSKFGNKLILFILIGLFLIIFNKQKIKKII